MEDTRTAENMTLLVKLSALDIGHISLALDAYVNDPDLPANYASEAKPMQERMDRIYRAMWELEKHGVLQMLDPTKC